MAISVVGVNNAAGQTGGTPGVTPTLPAGAAAGDRIYVSQIHIGPTAPTPTSWTALASAVQIGVTGSAPAAGSGRRHLSTYYRDYDGVWTMPLFAVSDAGNLSFAAVGAIAIRPTSGYAFDTPTSAFGNNSAGGPVVTAALTTHTGGLLLIGRGSAVDATSTSATLSQSGATFGTVTERTDASTASGFDVSGWTWTAPVTTGGTGALTLTNVLSLSTAQRGGALIVEQTESVVPAGNTGAFFAML